MVLLVDTSFKILKENKKTLSPIFNIIHRKLKVPYSKTPIKMDLIDRKHAISTIVYNEDTKMFLLNRQYKVGTNNVSIHTPFISVDQNENLIDQALNVLEKDLGISFDYEQNIKPLLLNSSEDFTNEQVHVLFFNIKNLQEIKVQDKEYLEHSWYTVEEIKNLIKMDILKASYSVSGLINFLYVNDI